MPIQALIIDEPWIGHIMAGRKTWEMRSRPTTKRGPIALVRKGSGQIVATASIVDCLPPLSLAQMPRAFERHRIPQCMVEAVGYKWFTPWLLAEIRVLERPVPYHHPSGAVTWVDLAPDVQAQLTSATAAPVLPLRTESSTLIQQVEAVHSPRSISAELPVVTAATFAGIRIPLSGGNVRNGHFSLRSARHILPADSIGGGNRFAAGKPITVAFTPGGVIETDVAGDKMILRERGAVRAFFDRTDAQEGDEVVLQRSGDRTFSVSLARSTD